MENTDYIEIRNAALQGPRITSLMPYFDNIADGISQVPKREILAEEDFLRRHHDYRHYHELFQRNIGTFYKHLCASVPFFIEQQCRIGVALQRLAQSRARTNNDLLTLYETSSADATNARTLSEYSHGLIRSLSDSPNIANFSNFKKLCQHNYSDIHLGPFVDITPEYLSSRTDRTYLKNGFDFIYENTTFQMYSSNRNDQIAYVKRILKEDGLIIFCEKLLHPVRSEYERRESIKNELFKSRYFTNFEISQKNSQILEEMEKCQVTLEELVSAIGNHFRYAYMIWNSTNFYEIVASNKKSRLQSFLDCLCDFYVPSPFLCEENVVRRLL